MLPNRQGVLLHEWTCFSNHWHAVVTDPDGNLPDFMAHVNRLVGTCVNAELGRFESLCPPSPVLVNHDVALAKSDGG
jgi:hypothetical protein